MRTGIGYDIHKLVQGRDLILGGVKIPNELGLFGHSDADVLIHSIIDALFGAAALRDIGYHYPDTDEAYKNANSMELLKDACSKLKNAGYKIVNIDSNIICQKPKLSKHIDLMRENIAKMLDLELNQISIKAKTNEGMDSVGEEKAIQAQAIVLIDDI